MALQHSSQPASSDPGVILSGSRIPRQSFHKCMAMWQSYLPCGSTHYPPHWRCTFKGKCSCQLPLLLHPQRLLFVRICLSGSVYSHLFIRICLSAPFHPHLFIRNCSSAFVYPHLFIRTCLSASVSFRCFDGAVC